MFGSKSKERATGIVSFQYENVRDISFKNKDLFVEFITEQLNKYNEEYPTNTMLKKCDNIPEIIGTYLICKDLIYMNDYLSPKSRNIIFKACMKEIKSHLAPDNIYAASIFAWVNGRFNQIKTELELDKPNARMHFVSFATLRALSNYIDGNCAGLNALEKNIDFHNSLSEHLNGYWNFFSETIRVEGFK